MSNTFSFLWNLKDFRMLAAGTPDNGFDMIKSPVFQPDPENRIEYHLVLSMNFGDMDLVIDCNQIPDRAELHLKSETYGISRLGDEKLLSKHECIMEDQSEIIATLDKDAVLNNYLQINDTLSLNIKLDMQLWRDDEPDSDVVVEESGEAAILNTCTVSSRLRTHRKRLVWAIDMSQLSSEGAFLQVTPPHKRVPPFRIVFSEDAEITIVAERGFPGLVQCTASVMKSEGIDCVREQGAWFMRRRLPALVNLDRLRAEKYFANTNGTLYLLFDFLFSPEHEMVHTIRSTVGTEICPARPRASPIEDFASLYRTGKNADAELHCDGRTFPIHSQIVGARSEVFEAMFRTDMAEATARSADITDLDPETVDRLLAYCYSNTIPPLNFAEAASLYTAADKYGVLSLRCHCSLVLMTLVASDNVCEALRFAHLHQDEDLFDSAVGFVRDHAEQVLPSDDWRELLMDSVKAAAKVMHRLLLDG